MADALLLPFIVPEKFKNRFSTTALKRQKYSPFFPPSGGAIPEEPQRRRYLQNSRSRLYQACAKNFELKILFQLLCTY